jgi:poly(hydroxyalkanoate) granule-associated protein
LIWVIAAARWLANAWTKSRDQETIMTKTLQEVAEARDASLCKVMLDSATQIWLAGVGALWLGVFNKVQDEGTKLFDTLVKEGERFQKHASGMTEQTVAGARDRKADTWDKLEDVFEDRVSRAMGRLGVPTRQDVDVLREKLEKLTAAVEKLSDSHVTSPIAGSSKRRQLPRP